MAKLTIDFSNLPDDEQVMIPSIPGEFLNGHEYEVESLEEDLRLSDSPIEVVEESPVATNEEGDVA